MFPFLSVEDASISALKAELLGTRSAIDHDDLRWNRRAPYTRETSIDGRIDGSMGDVAMNESTKRYISFGAKETERSNAVIKRFMLKCS